MAISFVRAAGPVGSTLNLDRLETLANDSMALAALRAELDERLAVRICAAEQVSNAALETVTRFVGRVNDVKGENPGMLIPGVPYMARFHADPAPNDGRPRVPAPIEQLHCDTGPNGPWSYGVLYTPNVPPGINMRFVDMRATYEALPIEMKKKIDGLTIHQFARATKDVPKPAGMPYPLVVKQPNTKRAALLLPMNRNGRVLELEEAEGRALTAQLWAIVEASPFRFEVPSQKNDLIIWDNIGACHDNPAYPRETGRTSWFCNTVREAPVEGFRLERAEA